MKKSRHTAILELIREENIETQSELAERLREMGYPATQSTICRDIRDLHLQKEPRANGRFCYTSKEETGNDFLDRLTRILRQSIDHVDSAGNLVVVKTLPGVANAAAAAIDNMQNTDIVGTIAGDDTILIILRTQEDARKLMQEIDKRL